MNLEPDYIEKMNRELDCNEKMNLEPDLVLKKWIWSQIILKKIYLEPDLVLKRRIWWKIEYESKIQVIIFSHEFWNLLIIYPTFQATVYSPRVSPYVHKLISVYCSKPRKWCIINAICKAKQGRSQSKGTVLWVRVQP